MALIDHSATYRTARLRNLPHRMRLRGILALVRGLELPKSPAFGDFGCSNGYVTERIRQVIGAARCIGYDHRDGHFERGRALYPDIEFRVLDLNRPAAELPRFDLVTCLETLEHVGRPDEALRNLIRAVKPGGTLVVSVPIEIGARGIAKFAAKLATGYRLGELPQRPGLLADYARTLVTGGRIGRFRDERAGWATHFGFDYRDVDDLLAKEPLPVRRWNSGLTRFYVLRAPVADTAAPRALQPSGGRDLPMAASLTLARPRTGPS